MKRCRVLTERFPYVMGFSVCFWKGVLADQLTQRALAKKTEVDTRQTLAMGLFSGCFTGCAYHFIYNGVFTRVFGASTGFRPAALKAVSDGTFVFPFLYM